MRFTDGLAIITGGGDGIGRELALRLCAEGCSVALCDISEQRLSAVRDACRNMTSAGNVKVSVHLCDVSDKTQVSSLAKAVSETHKVSGRRIFLFNNAGVSTAGSLFTDSEKEWERTFNVCWFGVYFMCRAFIPMLREAPEAYVINVSSVNGFYAWIGHFRPHTAYSAAKFAVKGFTEALRMDFLLNAPHIKVALVMPGHIGTGIAANSQRLSGEAASKHMGIRERHSAVRARICELRNAKDAYVESLDRNGQLAMYDQSLDAVPDEVLEQTVNMIGQSFRENAPTTAEQAAGIILDGVRQDQWRILVGDDAVQLDKLVREQPVAIYEDPTLANKVFGIGRPLAPQEQSKL